MLSFNVQLTFDSFPSPQRHINTLSISTVPSLLTSSIIMEAAFWIWTQKYCSSPLRSNVWSDSSRSYSHCHEQLHSVQETMFYQDNTYPHLSPQSLDRILRIRALVDHAAEDLTRALTHPDAIGQMSPRTIKGKGKGRPPHPTPPHPTDDPHTGVHQDDLIYTPSNINAATSPDTHDPIPLAIDQQQQSTITSPRTSPPPTIPPTDMSAHVPHNAPSTQTFADTVASQPPFTTRPKGFGRSAPPPLAHDRYHCKHAANAYPFPPRPVNLSPSPQSCDLQQVTVSAYAFADLPSPPTPPSTTTRPPCAIYQQSDCTLRPTTGSAP